MSEQRVPVGVRFKEAGRVYYFDGGGFDLQVGNYVVVDTSHGQEIGRVVISPDQVIVSEIKESLKPILRIAGSEDLERAEELKKRAAELILEARQEAERDSLDMRVVGGDYSLDGSQMTFYYTAEDRVDFRGLAKEFSSRLDIKVQFLQVGDRDRAKMVDGIGRCGERLCCASWLTTFPTVSIRHAKDQDLPLNPSKLSGACGRLLCCLTYEHEQYREIKGGLPKVGARISTPTGEAKVLKINVPKETIVLAIQGALENVEMPLDQFRLMYGTAVRPKEFEKFEQDLMAKDAATDQPAAPPPPSRPERRPRPERPRRPPSAAGPQQRNGSPQQRNGGQAAAPGEQAGGESSRRKRRRRRGGRGRRRPGEGGDGGGTST
jgi:cell fate regulator YaaT (PSP1 superfamily)